jgi:hypothetical protein
VPSVNVIDPDGIVNVSPAVTDFDAARSSDHRKFPEVLASHALMWVYVSVVLTLVHVSAASVAIDPDDAAANDACLRVVSVAAFDVPAAPGSPV